MKDLFIYETETSQLLVKHNREEGEWQVFTIINTKNNTTGELWVETGYDYFEWETWEDGFFTKKEEQEYLPYIGMYLTELYGTEIMNELRSEFSDLFTVFS